jgi:hypothetical protein
MSSKNITPEIISLHIPKTAGTSFRNILKNVYGDDQVIRLDINEKGTIKVNEELYNGKQLPSVKIIHGHFYYQTLKEKFDLPENIKFITWMRDPVKRVISNFNYLEKRLSEILTDAEEYNILNNMPRSLIDYARLEFNRNKQYKFLSGNTLKDFVFVGINEYFEEDLIGLKKILNWPEIPEVLYQNKTESLEKNVPKEILNEIASLNSDDVELYNYALQLRNT